MTTQSYQIRIRLGWNRRTWVSWIGSARKRLGLWLLTLLGLLTAPAIACLVFPQEILCVDNGDVQADALVLLGGAPQERPARAVELFRSGAAPTIIVSGAGDCTNSLQVLIAGGVPGNAVELECGSMSTRENAEFSIALLRAKGTKSAIIVTSWYHSRRALKCFRHYAPEIQFYSRPSYDAYRRPEWSCLGTRHYIRAEYVKLIGYWICYRISPV
jgi:uncharacterized SAM-binding protein YcdF (DUF218 family)